MSKAINELIIKAVIVAIVIINLGGSVNAQIIYPSVWADRQFQPYISNHLNSQFWHNPAFAGWDDQYELTLLSRTENFNLSDSRPSVSFATFNFPWYQLNGGFGLKVYYDEYEQRYASTSMGIGCAQNFQFELGEKALASVGFSLMLVQQNHFISDIRYPPPVGNTLPVIEKNDRRNKLDAGMGFAIKAGDFTLGGAFDHLNQPLWYYYTNVREIKVRRLQQLFLNASYNWEVYDDLFVKPNLMLRNFSGFLSIDGGLFFNFQDFAQAGASYRYFRTENLNVSVNSSSLVVLVGSKFLNKFQINVAYDVPLATNNLFFNQNNGNNLEFVVKYLIEKPNLSEKELSLL